jgi:glycosyltransferase involved in cell wall biosynthesis
MLHVVFPSYFYEPTMSSPEDLLETYPTLAGWVTALHERGAKVTVLQRFHRKMEFLYRGVRMVLVPDRFGPTLHKWQVPFGFHRALQTELTQTKSPEEPTVVHFSGLIFPLQLRSVRTNLPSRCAIAVQHHAEKPSRGIRRSLERWGLRTADGFFFAAKELATAWTADGMIRVDQPVYQVMEGSTDFRRQDRAAARAHTGLSGDPILLWVGRLIPLKDPLTVLRGFEYFLHHRPGARLYMAYGSNDLLPEVRARIAQSRLLSGSVTLLDSRPHAELEPLFNSADYFVLGSHYEGSGYALAEALACGVVPVVTDIPSFKVMTSEGTIGACWPPGDSAGFLTALLRVLDKPWQALSDQAVRFFEEQLSYRAIGCKALKAYDELAAKRAKVKK